MGPGSIVGDKYRVGRQIGRGGMGVIVEATHLQLGTQVAIKILRANPSEKPEVAERFLREARAAAQLKSEHICRVHDYGTLPDQAPFMVMELLEGRDLGTLVDAEGPLPYQLVAHYVLQACAGLAEAHARGLIHRDLKPGNLFLVGGLLEGIKVLDFGLARIHEGGLADGLFTKEGTTLGTTPYMPPEQAKGRPIDERADVFAMGATMFRLITGRYLHEASGAFDLLMKMAREPAPPIATYAPDLPPHVAMVIDRALTFDRDQRYADAQTMLDDVSAVLDRRPPPHAVRLGGGVDRAALTQAKGRERESLAAVTQGPSTSEEIPIFLSGFSSILESVSTDRDPVPVTPPDETTRPIVGRPAIENTMISPGNEPKDKG